MKLGRELRRYRRTAKVSQGDLAAEAGYHGYASAISRRETSEIAMTLSELHMLKSAIARIVERRQREMSVSEVLAP